MNQKFSHKTVVWTHTSIANLRWRRWTDNPWQRTSQLTSVDQELWLINSRSMAPWVRSDRAASRSYPKLLGQALAQKFWKPSRRSASGGRRAGACRAAFWALGTLGIFITREMRSATELARASVGLTLVCVFASSWHWILNYNYTPKLCSSINIFKGTFTFSSGSRLKVFEALRRLPAFRFLLNS